LLNLEKPNAIVAELFSHNYIPEYRKALQHYKNEIAIDAVVFKVSPHAIYLNLFDDKIKVKLSLTSPDDASVKVGDIIPVIITHLSATRVVVKRFGN
jgi:hypothetical protein